MVKNDVGESEEDIKLFLNKFIPIIFDAEKRSRFSFESFASILDKFANLQNIFGCRDSNRTPPQLLTSELIPRSACLERILGSYQSHVRRHK